MKILFIHQNAPGQFGKLSAALAARGHEVALMGQHLRQVIPGVKFFEYRPASLSPVHPYLADLNSNAENGRQIFNQLRTLANDNWIPDLVVGHNGWGEMLFIKDALPQARSVGYFEFFYRKGGQDVGFDPDFPPSLEDKARLKIRNLTNLIGLDAVDAGWAPTAWQRSVYPAEWRDKITTIHDGIDTKYMCPGIDENAPVQLPNGRQLPAGAQLVTFVARNLEPYRGFHVLMRALHKMLLRLPEAHFLIVGGTGTSYGRKPSGGRSWKDVLLEENPLETNRVSIIDRIPYDALRSLFRATSAHVYLTYPFVLSWSVLEAMSCGALVVASRTPPVTEVIVDNENGLLFDFFDIDGLVDRVAYALENKAGLANVKRNARHTTIARFDFETVSLPAQLAFLEKVAGAKL